MTRWDFDFEGLKHKDRSPNALGKKEALLELSLLISTRCFRAFCIRKGGKTMNEIEKGKARDTDKVLTDLNIIESMLSEVIFHWMLPPFDIDGLRRAYEEVKKIREKYLANGIWE